MKSRKGTVAVRGPGCAGEIVGTVLGLLVLGLFVALLSYEPADPPAGAGPAVANLCGLMGACGAAFLMNALGYASYLAVVWLAMAAYRRFRPVTPAEQCFEAVGFLVALLATALLLSRVGPGSGGWLGDLLTRWSGRWLGNWGTLVAALGGIVLALDIGTRFSVRGTAAAAGRAVRALCRRGMAACRGTGAELIAGWREWRAARPVPKPVPGPLRKPIRGDPFPATEESFDRPATPYDQTGYRLPTADLFDEPPPVVATASDGELNAVADKLVRTLREFGIDTRRGEIIPGPVVTMYELIPAPGTPVSKVTAREVDLKLALPAPSIRIVAPIPGRKAIGIEIPNPYRQVIGFREIAQSPAYRDCPGLLKVVLGKDIVGTPRVFELDRMPHLLIGGQTGSGKTVCLHVLINSLLLNAAPRQVKFVLIDPKMVELKCYNGLPHLLVPVITDSREATRALKWLCGEMEQRYAMLAGLEAQNLVRYNVKAEAMGRPELPYLVVVIDELADLMAVGAQECEGHIHRLTSMARAVGIHLVIATQRPSVDVITGLIKANLPARIAFAVIARVDSRTILDANGAENLLGRGDLLFQDPGVPQPVRLQGACLNEGEIERVVSFVRAQARPEYAMESFRVDGDGTGQSGALTAEDREFLDPARRLILQSQRGSTSLLQRLLKVAHPRAVRLMEQFERDGLVGPVEGPKPRRVLVTYEDYYGGQPDGIIEMSDEDTR